MTVTRDDARFDEINQLRLSIDNFDSAMIHILAERFRITKAVGHLKAEKDLPPSSPDREKEQAERWRALAAEAGLDPGFAEKLLNFIVSEVIENHKKIRK